MGREHSPERSYSAADGKYLSLACTHRGAGMVGVSLGVQRRGAGSPGADAEKGQAGSWHARPHRVTSTQGTIWKGTI